MTRNLPPDASTVTVRGPRLQGWGSPAVTPGRESEGPELAAVQTAIGSLSSREALPTRASVRRRAAPDAQHAAALQPVPDAESGPSARGPMRRAVFFSSPSRGAEAPRERTQI